MGGILYNSRLRSGFSPVIIFILISGICTSCSSPPEKVNIFSPASDESISRSTVFCSWQSMENAAFYHIQIAGNRDFSNPLLDKTVDADKTLIEYDCEDRSETVFFIRVRWRSGWSGWSKWSKTVRFFRDEGAPSYFAKTYGGPGVEDWVSVCRTDDGGYVLIGRTDSFGVGEFDLLAVKCNATGDIQWQYTYGGSKEDKPGSFGKAVIPSSDGGYLISAVTSSWGTSGKPTPWVVKLHSDGTIAWQKWYGNSYSSYHRSILLEDEDGNIILVTIYQSVEDKNSRDIWIIKLTSDGENVIWQRTYGGKEGDYPWTARISKSTVRPGDYLITGFTYSQDIGFSDPNVSNGLFLRIEPEKGDVLAARHYGWDTGWFEYDQIRDFTEKQSGELFFIGFSGSTRLNVGYHSYDIWFARANPWGVIDTDANVLLHSPGNDWHDVGHMIVPGENKNLYFCGRIDSRYTELGGYYGDDGFLACSTEEGRLLWSKRFVAGADSSDFFRAVVRRDDGFVLVGETDTFGAGGRDLWVLKTGEEGYLPNTSFDMVDSGLEIKDRPFQQGDTYAVSAAGVYLEMGNTDAVPRPAELIVTEQ